MKIRLFFRSQVALFLLALFCSVNSLAEPLPRPAGLEPDINFWRRVFGEIDSFQGFIHDNQRLDVVYKKIQFSPSESYAQRQLRIDAERKRVSECLLQLAQEPRANLSGEQKKVLALWGENASSAELRSASERVRYQQGQADKFRAGLIRSGRWESHIRNALREQGVPEELAVLPQVESSFNPVARSHADALGLWQFMRGTGRLYMHVDHVVDERLDPFRSSQSAARLLASNYALTGTWPLAITGYNHGAAAMLRAAKQLGTTDIETIVRNYRGPAFGFASRNFYVSLLAAIDVTQDAEHYFGPVERDPNDTSGTVLLDDFLTPKSICRALNLEEAKFRLLNPALQDPVWNGEKYVPRGYAVRLPSSSEDFQAQLASIPAAERYDAQIPDKYHRVRPGDTLSGIAGRYKVSVRQLMALNNLHDQHRIRAGQTLILPGAYASGATLVAAPQSVGRVPKPAVTSQARSVEPAAVASAATTAAGLQLTSGRYAVSSDDTVNIQPEETLGHYAEWLGLDLQRLQQLNGLHRSSPLVVGKSLRLDFSKTARSEFERRREKYHRDLIEVFNERFQIVGRREHIVRRGESLWTLAKANPKVPLWLLYQYNPGLDLSSIQVGATVAVPVVRLNS